MATVTLRNLGGSVVIALPKKILDLVQLHTGSKVSIDVQDGKLIIEPKQSRVISSLNSWHSAIYQCL